MMTSVVITVACFLIRLLYNMHRILQSRSIWIFRQNSIQRFTASYVTKTSFSRLATEAIPRRHQRHSSRQPLLLHLLQSPHPTTGTETIVAVAALAHTTTCLLTLQRHQCPVQPMILIVIAAAVSTVAMITRTTMHIHHHILILLLQSLAAAAITSAMLVATGTRGAHFE